MWPPHSIRLRQPKSLDTHTLDIKLLNICGTSKHRHLAEMSRFSQVQSDGDGWPLFSMPSRHDDFNSEVQAEESTNGSCAGWVICLILTKETFWLSYLPMLNSIFWAWRSFSQLSWKEAWKEHMLLAFCCRMRKGKNCGHTLAADILRELYIIIGHKSIHKNVFPFSCN